MKPTKLTQAIEKVVGAKVRAVEQVVKELIDPLAKLGNPEELIGKPYEQWTPMDLAMLSQIYGSDNDTPLAKLIFNREYSKLQELEEGQYGSIRL